MHTCIVILLPFPFYPQAPDVTYISHNKNRYTLYLIIHKGVLLGRGYIHCRFLLWEIYVTSGACVSTICTCLLHALLRTIEEPDNMKLWHFMKSALQFLQKLQKFWNQILLNTRHQFFLMILTPLGKLIKHVLLLKSMRFWQGL